MHAGTRVDSSITIILEVLNLFEDLLVGGNVHLEVIGLKFPLVLEGAQLLFKLSGVALGGAWSKKHELEFLEGSVEVAGLAKLIDAGLSNGHLNNDPEFSIAHDRITKNLGDLTLSSLQVVSTP